MKCKNQNRQDKYGQIRSLFPTACADPLLSALLVGHSGLHALPSWSRTAEFSDFSKQKTPPPSKLWKLVLKPFHNLSDSFAFSLWKSMFEHHRLTCPGVNQCPSRARPGNCENMTMTTHDASQERRCVGSTPILWRKSSVIPQPPERVSPNGCHSGVDSAVPAAREYPSQLATRNHTTHHYKTHASKRLHLLTSSWTWGSAPPCAPSSGQSCSSLRRVLLGVLW